MTIKCVQIIVFAQPGDITKPAIFKQARALAIVVFVSLRFWFAFFWFFGGLGRLWTTRSYNKFVHFERKQLYKGH